MPQNEYVNAILRYNNDIYAIVRLYAEIHPDRPAKPLSDLFLERVKLIP